MQKNWLVKTLVLSVAVLFIGVSSQPVYAVDIIKKSTAPISDCNILLPLASEKTIYVDDDNTEGPWDGSLEHPYLHISDGVANADSGDTVFVFSGDYHEFFHITKSSIKLVGERQKINNHH